MLFNPHILPKVYQAVFKDEFTREDLVQHIINETTVRPEIKDFMEPYSEPSQKNFIEAYAKLKAEVLLDLNSLRDSAQNIHNDFTEIAQEHLWSIQQKKLFDLQCRWRAEEIKLPEVQSTSDFPYWGHQIKLCPFLTPISEQEFELYVNFLTITEYVIDGFDDPKWQDYDGFKMNYKNDNMGEELPDWYEYHNNHTGNTILLSLPDVRGAKEEFYKDIWRKHNLSKGPSTFKPYLVFYDEEKRDLFFNLFESKLFIKNVAEYNSLNSTLAANEDVEEAVRYLLQWPGAIEIAAHKDWREAILETKRRFVHAKTIETLHIVYEEYKMREDLGLPHQDKIDERYTWHKSLSHFVIEGRKLNGEPADFNF